MEPSLPPPRPAPPLAPTTASATSRRHHWNRAIVISAIFFLVPFVFILLIASKPLAEANLLQFSWPSNVRPVRQSGGRLSRPGTI